MEFKGIKDIGDHNWDIIEKSIHPYPLIEPKECSSLPKTARRGVFIEKDLDDPQKFLLRVVAPETLEYG